MEQAFVIKISGKRGESVEITCRFLLERDSYSI